MKGPLVYIRKYILGKFSLVIPGWIIITDNIEPLISIPSTAHAQLGAIFPNDLRKMAPLVKAAHIGFFTKIIIIPYLVVPMLNDMITRWLFVTVVFVLILTIRVVRSLLKMSTRCYVLGPVLRPVVDVVFKDQRRRAVFGSKFVVPVQEFTFEFVGTFLIRDADEG